LKGEPAIEQTILKSMMVALSLMAEAKKQGWTLISMKNDWKRIFARGQ
jgi:hypothetical protein